jgi:hypothetical protein
MNRIYVYLLVLGSLSGCAQTKSIKFKTDTFMSAGKEQKFTIQVPKNYIDVKSNESTYLFKQFDYEDGSIMYISLDISYSNSPNKDNWSKCSKPQERYKCEEGVQENGLYWKEVLRDNLVIGYYDVPKERITEFDQALLTLRQK